MCVCLCVSVRARAADVEAFGKSCDEDLDASKSVNVTRIQTHSFVSD